MKYAEISRNTAKEIFVKSWRYSAVIIKTVSLVPLSLFAKMHSAVLGISLNLHFNLMNTDEGRRAIICFTFLLSKCTINL